MSSGDVNAAAETIRHYIGTPLAGDSPRGQAATALDALVAEIERLQEKFEVTHDQLERKGYAAEQLRAERAAVRRERDAVADLLARSQVEVERLQEALSTILTRCEDANAEWSRLDVAAVARSVLAAEEEQE